MANFIKTLLGMSNEAEIKKLMKTVGRINELEPSMQALSDEELRGKTAEYKTRAENGESLDSILPEAFASVREGAVRSIGQRHFDMQLLGGIVLHQGRIAEMKTGEGKTICCTLPGYLNAITGHGVHIVTVNEYLAKFHSEIMGKIYRFLGMNVGLILAGMESADKKQAYLADITYGTNNEFGFDYLRDNMVTTKSRMVQRELNYAIVDEVDSILIDEARTPLIISGPGEKSTDMYKTVDRFVSTLRRDTDYLVDEKKKTINLTDEGVARCESYFKLENLTDVENTELNHHINQAIRAHALMLRDRDYVVRNGEVVIVDEFTGRLMVGRRYSEGLHQAIEAKENVQVARESRTLATITFQNYFRMYKKLAGMTGTAKTEEDEFQGIYNLDVVEVPTNKPMIRKDLNDVVYRSEKGKFEAVTEEVIRRHHTGQPILVGTVSVEKSEMLSGMMKSRGIKHEVLNAKHHEREAEIVAQAGQKGHVTIATNMAGRGTDILLGGNAEFMARQEMRREGLDPEVIEQAIGQFATEDEEILKAREIFNDLYKKYKVETDAAHDEVVSLGGLHIIGTERHESRRIDNQLRGRAGRQGDPGSSQFFISLGDDLMRLFGSDRILPMVERLGMPEDQPIEMKMLTKQIENAQKRVEGRNYDTRRHVLQYDDVMNKQREIIYGQRRQVLDGIDIKSTVVSMAKEIISVAAGTYCSGASTPELWDLASLSQYFKNLTGIDGLLNYTPEEIDRLTVQQIEDKLFAAWEEAYAKKENEINAAGIDMREVERTLLLRAVDSHWMDHIDAMDQLRQGIGLRAYAQRDPIIEYRLEGSYMFEEMVHGIREQLISTLMRVSVRKPPERRQAPAATPGRQATVRKPASVQKVGRNDPCPCGSGKKYKNCHGRPGMNAEV